MRKIYLFLFLAMVFAGVKGFSQCSTIQPLTLATSTSVTLSGTGNWVLGGCNQNALGQEQIYQFTAPVTGTYILNVLSASGGYIDYYYKPVSAGCSPSGWTCIIDVNGISSIPIGTLTAGTQYYILADAEGTGSRTHSFSVSAVTTITVAENLSPFLACDLAGSLPQSFTIEAEGLSNVLNITPSADFGVSLTPNGGFAGPIQLLPTAGSISPTTIYVKLFGSAPGNYTGNISCTSTGAATQNIPVSGTLASAPTVNPVPSQAFCRNSTTNPINFTGTVAGTNYLWTNSNPAIGLPASGFGNIPSFTATNSTSAPINGQLSVTPIIGTPAPDLLYYKFDGAGATVPNNATNPPAGTINASINGAITQGGSGSCGGVLQSTRVSTNDYLNTNWAANVNGSWTISFIVSGFQTANSTVYDIAGSINGTKPLYITFNPNGNASTFSVNFGNPFLVLGNFSTTKTVTFVYNHSTQQLSGYLDGVLGQTISGDFTINTNGFYVGNIDGGVVGSSPAGSLIDEFRMYSWALSSSEVTALVGSCNASGACTGTPTNFNISVFPDLTVDDPADQTVCAGSATTAVNFTGTSGAVYNWTNNNPLIGLAASGTGNIPSFIPTFSGTAPITATITVTPSFSGGPSCTSSSQTFTITVSPIPNVNNVASQTLCNNAATTPINFSGSIPGTNYTWTNSNPSIGLPANGSGNIPSFTALNTTGSPVTSTITVTPVFGGTNGNSVTIPMPAQAQSFNGLTRGYWFTAPADFVITSLLVPTDNAGDQNIAVLKFNGNTPPPVFSGTTNAFTTEFITQANTSSGAIAVNIPITAGEVIGILGTRNNVSSYAPMPFSTTIGGFNVALTRMGMQANLSTTAPQNIWQETSGNFSRVFFDYIIPSGSCTGSPEIFGVTVNPSPAVNPVSSQNVCTGSTTTAINFTGNVAGAAYNWTNSNPSIGLAASGTGNITSFTAINAGTTTETAIITVTPVDPSSSCPGTPENFTISVSPVPTGTATPASQTVCSESAINTIAFTGNVPGITFDWTRDNLATVTGIPGVGAGNTITGTLTNTTNAPITVTFTVTPSLGGCVGTPFTVTVIVNESLPIASATPSTQTICSGNITDIIPSANYAGTTFSWTRDNTASVTGIAASGTGTISGTLFNTTTSPITITFTILPTFNGCDGAAITATVLVNAVPTITCPANIVTNNTTGICGTTVNYNTNVTGAPAPTLTYILSGATTGSGNGNGAGSLFNVGVTTVTVTASNICGAASCSFTVTVNDTENPTITCPANIQANTDAGVCAGTVATPNPTTIDNCVVAELTWVLAGATTGSSPATGINNVGTRLFNKGTTTITYIVKDAAGNSATCSYTVTVRDLENPVIICSPNITVTTQAGLCVAEVSYTITATDNCPGVITQLVSGPASGATFSLGTTTVTWRAIDAATNISTNCSFTVTVLDGQLPVISQQPTNKTVCAGSPVTFSVTAATAPHAGGPIAYQWQQWSGLAWSNISGATASTYTISNPTLSMNTNTFRVILTGLCSTVTSGSASLFVNPLPTITVNTNSLNSLLPAQSTSIVATVNPTGGSFVWRRNGNIVAGAISETIAPLTVDQLGTYNTTYTDLNGCKITSTDIVINGLPSENMWVYPNPNQGEFQVRFYNNFGEPVNVLVYNAAGQLVYNKLSVAGNAYSRIDVKLGNNSQGIYVVKIIGRSGREFAAKRIVVYR